MKLTGKEILKGVHRHLSRMGGYRGERVVFLSDAEEAIDKAFTEHSKKRDYAVALIAELIHVIEYPEKSIISEVNDMIKEAKSQGYGM